MSVAPDDRWSRLQAVFREALARAPGERASFIEAASGDDADFAAEVRRLVDAHDTSDGWLEISPAEAPPPDAADGLPTPGMTVGRYRIERELGRGGMGVVFEATQAHPRRSVALKIIRPDVSSPRMRRRFEHEAHVLGALQHPGVAQVHDAGFLDVPGHAQRLPFVAMELIRGRPLTEYADAHDLSVRARLDLLARVCDAVHHAHQKGVIHRDLKPANILVVEGGQPKVLDFGVARATEGDLVLTTVQTDVGALLGTVPYMSPEQAAGDPDAIDARSDVYALGVVGYELLSGHLPYDLRRKMIHEAVRVIREQEPTRLSTFGRALRGDVETIIAKALEKDPARRYAGANELAADLRRYLGDEPIVARPPSRAYQCRKFAQRHKSLVAAATLVFLTACAAAVVSTTFAVRQGRTLVKLAQANEDLEAALTDAATARGEAEAARDRALESARLAATVNEFVRDDLLAWANPFVNAGTPPTLRDLLDRASATVDARFAGDPLVGAALHGTLGSAYLGLGDRAAAVMHTEREYDALRRAHGAADRATLDARLRLGTAHLARGDTAPALTMHEEVLAIARNQFGDEDPLVIEVLQQLVYDHLGDGSRETAATLIQEARELAARALPPDHPLHLSLRTALADVYRYRGNLPGAITELEGVLADTRSRLGERHPDVVMQLYLLGDTYRLASRHADAERVLEEAVRIGRDVMGERSLGTMRIRMALGDLYAADGRYAEAEALLDELLATAIEDFGEDRTETHDVMHDLADVYLRTGRPAESIALLERILPAVRRSHGDDHPGTMSVLNTLADAYRDVGRLADAEAILRETVDRGNAVFGPDDPNTIAAMNSLAILYQETGRAAESVPLLEEVIRFSRARLPADHPALLTELNNLAGAWAELGRRDDAIALYAEIVPHLRAKPGTDHPLTISTIANYGQACLENGDVDRARVLIDEAIELASHVLPEGHWLIACFRAERAECDLATDAFAEAEARLLRSYDELASGLGPGNPRTRTCATKLARLYERWDRPTDAAVWHQRGQP